MTISYRFSKLLYNPLMQKKKKKIAHEVLNNHFLMCKSSVTNLSK